MYSTVSVRIGISWCVQYCVSKDRDLLVCTVLCQQGQGSLGVYSTVSVRIGITWCVQYCVSKDRDHFVCTVLCQ